MSYQHGNGMSIEKPLSISDILSASRSIIDRFDLLPLLAFVLNRSKEFILTHPEYILTKAQMRRWEEVKKRRLSGEPVSYITGIKEFYSLEFRVNNHTLIPRPETETLVDEVIENHPATLLDVGTGCGAIAVSVKFHIPGCLVTATDIDPKALRVASRNAKNILGRNSIRFIKSDYFDTLTGLRFDIVASNPPYVKTDDLSGLQREIRFEPARALDGGRDGLDAYRVLLAESAAHLNASGLLIVEISPELKKGLTDLAARHGWEIKKVVPDLAGHGRVMVLTQKKGVVKQI